MYSNSNSFGTLAGDLPAAAYGAWFRPVVWQAAPGRK